MCKCLMYSILPIVGLASAQAAKARIAQLQSALARQNSLPEQPTVPGRVPIHASSCCLAMTID